MASRGALAAAFFGGTATAVAALAGWLAASGQLDGTMKKAQSAIGAVLGRDEASPQPSGRAGGKQQGGARAITVEVADAKNLKTTADIRAIGSLQSDESVVIAPEVAGRIAEINFIEGRPVKKDDVLVRLDTALANAEVADAQARLTLAQANNERARTLSRTGAVTGKSRDEAVANYQTSLAALELAKTRLSKLELRAPYDGVAGLRGVSAGAFVNVGTPIANVEKVDVLKVDFKIPEVHLGDVKTGQRIELTVDAYPGRTFEGEIYALNPAVDVNGRALQLRARLANPDQVLKPGLFARILIKGTTEREVVMIPEAAVLPRGQETFVFVVDGNKAVERKVKLGQRANAQVEVVEGLTPPATIVTAGQQKLRDGATIEIVPNGANNGAQPTAGSFPARVTPGRNG
jgi:membrane fusion protein (multidrug efflux system)